MREESNRWVTIGPVSRMTGLSVRTIRYLHERGYAPETWLEIGDNRVRVYDTATIERFCRIAAFLKDGFPPGLAAYKADAPVP